jgi:hypothetical protein
MDANITSDPGMSSRAIYQITVIGKLDEKWVDWFNGTLINFEQKTAEKPQTVLTCQVRDQAELIGILNRLNSLNLPLLNVKVINKEGEYHV